MKSWTDITIAVAAFMLAGCASAPVIVAPAPVPEPPPPRPISISSDVKEFVEALEATHSYILDHQADIAAGSIADYEAATSIEIPDHPSVLSALTLFSTDLRTTIQASLDRSVRYRAMIDEILGEYELPKALAYLPVIESGYITTNMSRVGAYGIWQFMPGTAREYGLRVDWWTDERADPEKSTRAAAEYLNDLYTKFGDWPLALASYNAGPGRVRRSLHSTRQEGFWDLHRLASLPRETRGYVPTFYATLMIVSQPETYGFLLCEPEPIRQNWKEVEVDGPVTLRYIAEAAGVELGTLIELNPAYSRQMLPPGRSKLRVPEAAAPSVALLARTMSGDDPYLDVSRYTVRRGDSLKSLSRTLGVSSRTLSAMNGGITKLRTGSTILIPVSQPELSARLHAKPKAKVHVVQQGETIYSIARKNGLSVDELLSLNNISRKHVLKVGERLRVGTAPAVTAGGM